MPFFLAMPTEYEFANGITIHINFEVQERIEALVSWRSLQMKKMILTILFFLSCDSLSNIGGSSNVKGLSAY